MTPLISEEPVIPLFVHGRLPADGILGDVLVCTHQHCQKKQTMRHGRTPVECITGILGVPARQPPAHRYA